MFKKHIKDRAGQHIIKCDHCWTRINVATVEIKIRKAGEYNGEEVELHYFTCSNDKCKAEYPINYYTSSMGIRLEKQNILKKQIANLVASAAPMKGHNRVVMAKKAEKKTKEWERAFAGLVAEQEEIKAFFGVQGKEAGHAGV